MSGTSAKRWSFLIRARRPEPVMPASDTTPAGGATVMNSTSAAAVRELHVLQPNPHKVEGHVVNGGADGARTRDLRRDRPAF